jgi:5'-nucleotidase
MKSENNTQKKIVYVDMDNVLVDFPYGIECLSEEDKIKYDGNYDECPGIFSLMRPMPDAIESYRTLAKHFDTYILSTSPWHNPSAWIHKLEWVQKYLGQDKDTPAYKRLILSHHKHLNKGDFLIDDRTKNGADRFEGELIHFGTEKFPDWKSVIEYLLKQA